MVRWQLCGSCTQPSYRWGPRHMSILQSETQRLYRLRFSESDRRAKAAVWKILVEEFAVKLERLEKQRERLDPRESSLPRRPAA